MNSRNEDTSLNLSAFLDGELPPEKTAEMAERLARSPELRGKMEALRQTRDLLGSLPRRSAPEGFAEDVMERVERDRLLKASSPVRRSRSPLWVKAAASAAIILITGGLLLYVVDVFHDEDWVSRQEKKESAEKITLAHNDAPPPPVKTLNAAEIKSETLDRGRDASRLRLNVSLAPASAPESKVAATDETGSGLTDSGFAPAYGNAGRRTAASPAMNIIRPANPNADERREKDAAYDLNGGGMTIVLETKARSDGPMPPAPAAAADTVAMAAEQRTWETARQSLRDIEQPALGEEAKLDNRDLVFVRSRIENLPLNLQQISAQSAWSNATIMHTRVDEFLKQLPGVNNKVQLDELKPRATCR